MTLHSDVENGRIHVEGISKVEIGYLPKAVCTFNLESIDFSDVAEVILHQCLLVMDLADFCSALHLWIGNGSSLRQGLMFVL